MAQQNIAIGAANEGNGDTLFDAFTKIQANFVDLYTEQPGDVDSITATAPISRDQATGAVTISLNDDGVTHSKLEGRYTAVISNSTTTSQTLDAGSYSAFILTGNLGASTLTIDGMKTGQVVDILLAGADLSSAVITLATGFTASTISKVGSASLDTSAKNHIQVVCIDDNDSAAIVNYSINTYATSTTP